MFAFVPIGANLTLGVAILSYCDALTFGFSADSDAIKDVEVFPALLHTALEELGEAAGVELR